MCASLFLKIFLMVNKNIASIFLLLTYILYIHFWNLNMFQGEKKTFIFIFLKRPHKPQITRIFVSFFNTIFTLESSLILTRHSKNIKVNIYQCVFFEKNIYFHLWLLCKIDLIQKQLRYY